MYSTLATVKRQKRLRRNSSDCWLRFGRLSLEKRDFGGGMVYLWNVFRLNAEIGESVSGVDLGHVEDQPPAVARGGDESSEVRDLPQGECRDRASDLADGHRAHHQLKLAGLLVFHHLGVVLQAQIERRKPGRGVPCRSAFHQLGGKNQSIHRCCALSSALADCGIRLQAVVSWADLRASSFSTAFIMTEGAVSALSRSTVRW